MSGKKILGEERRQLILTKLKNVQRPVTGSELAKSMNVSRQVIVSDITLLKARNEPIIATSQGYLFLPKRKEKTVEKTVACLHSPDRTEEELNLLVDIGVLVQDVKIEHPVYGDLTASIRVATRNDVKEFMKKVRETKASFLSELTDGVHLHTLVADSDETLLHAEETLRLHGFLVQS
ncbi:transcription repressor NadR [Bacillus sp. 2205SS5-2]|uniref:transcription repressor NadR n=1 Tax=Bacillus sp. 2205SS5-2 TaxID=3109031 RepID=UPI00300586CF